MRQAVLVLVALALTGCETTAEKSAKLEKQALRVHANAPAKEKGLSITRASTAVKVLSSTLLRSPEGIAAVVTLRNTSSRTLRDVPIEITLKSSAGTTVYTNDTPGLGAPLTSAPLLPAHAAFDWIDDQIQASGTPATVSTKLGEGTPVTGPIPPLAVTGAHLFDDATSGEGAEGGVANHSKIAQQELVVYALARRGGHIVAAGRAVLPSAPAGTSTRFQAFLIGEPKGGRLQVSAPPTTLE